VDTGDTGLDEGCGLLEAGRLWVTQTSAEELRRCDIPQGFVFSLAYQEPDMDPSQPPATEPAPVHAAPEPAAEPQPAAPLQPSGNTESVAPPAPTAENLADMAQKIDNPVLVVVLAIIALLGVGLWKHLGKLADQKNAVDMKRLEIEAETAKRVPKAQPPPCQAANAALEAKLSSLEARLGKVESTSLALPPGFDAEELDERVRKLELARLKKGDE
jgi:hypothetical protein